MIGRVAADRAIGDGASTVNRTTVAAKRTATQRGVTADGAVLDYEALARADRYVRVASCEAGAIAVRVNQTKNLVTADGTVLDHGAAGASGDSASVTVTPIVSDAALINR